MRKDLKHALAVLAKDMAIELLQYEHKGPGDTIEATAYRLQSRFGVNASILMQCWSRDPREMLVSRWVALFLAHHQVFGEKVIERYENKRKKLAKSHPIWISMADAIAGRDKR